MKTTVIPTLWAHTCELTVLYRKHLYTYIYRPQFIHHVFSLMLKLRPPPLVSNLRPLPVTHISHRDETMLE